MSRLPGFAISVALACGGCGLFGGVAAAPAGPPPPEKEAALCPTWTPVDVGPLSAESDQADLAKAAERLRSLVSQGQLLRAAALANAASIRCPMATLSRAEAQRFNTALAELREALNAPKTGDEYVAEARRHAASASAAQAKAAWDRALIAYRRALNLWPRRTALIPTTPTAATARLCTPELRLDKPADLGVEVQQLTGTERHAWRLSTPEGATLFDGPAQQVAAINRDTWLVSQEWDELTLMTRSGRPRSLGHPCGSSWQLLGDWLIGTTTYPTLQMINLAHPERSFARLGDPSFGVRASRVGEYVEVSDVEDDVRRAVVIFRPDIENPNDTAWTRERLNGQGDARLFLSSKWGGVLAGIGSAADPKQALGFAWHVDAIQLETGKLLAHLVMPADAETRPAATIDERYGLLAVGNGKQVRRAGLGLGAAQQVSANEVAAQVEDIRVTPDGVLCTSQVAMRRYDSCAMQVSADLSGGTRHRAPQRFCLANATLAWSGVVPPQRGLEHVVSQARSGMFSVCGQRLAADGASAAFLEVKPGSSSDKIYTAAQLSVIDARSGQRRWRAALQGSADPMYPFIDVAFSPDSAYLAVLYEHRVQVYRVKDGAQVGKDLNGEGWMEVVWSSDQAFSGGNAEDETMSLGSGAFNAPTAQVGLGSNIPIDERCVFGTYITPVEVCASLPHAAP